MTQHTPGPWSYAKCRCGQKGCRSYTIGHSGAEGMFQEADARLIAAAPDMLNALLFVADELNSHPEQGRWLGEQVRAAIAKARPG